MDARNHLGNALALGALLVAALLIWPAATVRAQSCTVTQVGPPEISYNRPAINASGDIAYFHDPDGPAAPALQIVVHHALTGTTTVLDLPDSASASSAALDINDRGDLVWSNSVLSGGWQVMHYDAATGVITQLSEPFTINFTPRINNRGDVVWSRRGSFPASQVYRYEAASGAVTQVSTALHRSNLLPDINDAGDIVWMAGNGNTTGTFEVMLYQAATASITQITTNTRDDYAPAINNAGQIAWVDYNSAESHIVAVRYDIATGTRTEVSQPNVGTTTLDLNDNGDVVWLQGFGPDNAVAWYEEASGSVFVLPPGDWQAQQPLISDAGEVMWQEIVWNSDNTDYLNYRYLYSPIRPIADAGPEQSGGRDAVILLDGSASCDPNGDALDYAWRFVSTPAGSAAVLNDADAPLASFSLDVPGEFLLELVVSDGATWSVPATVRVGSINVPPVAEAGPDLVLSRVGEPVPLDGRASYDEEGDALSYAWSVVQAPRFSGTDFFDDPTSPTPLFTPPLQGDYVLELVVTDEFGAASAADPLLISFDNVPPVADAGGDQAVVIGDFVDIDATGSHDANGDRLTYFWEFTSRPEGSIAWLDGIIGADLDGMIGGPTTRFFADVPGTYVVTLTVRTYVDGIGYEHDTDVVTIEAVSFTEGATQTLIELVHTLNGLPRGAFRHRLQRRVLVKMVAVALRAIDRGHIERAEKLLSLLVLPRSDGCINTGEPDRRDWVRTCEAQGQVAPLVQLALDQLAGEQNPPEPPPPPPPPPPGGGGL